MAIAVVAGDSSEQSGAQVYPSVAYVTEASVRAHVDLYSWVFIDSKVACTFARGLSAPRTPVCTCDIASHLSCCYIFIVPFAVAQSISMRVAHAKLACT